MIDLVQIEAWQADRPGAALERVERTLPGLANDELLLEVLHCGLCHSDLAMLANTWGMTSYPLVPGHEAVGRVIAVGPNVETSIIGQIRGVGWNSGSCCHCSQCLSGMGNLCPSLEQTIVGRLGAFASHVIARQDWAMPLPDGLSVADAGPLFCGGITTFAALFDEGVSPTARVAVVGIGGLGHLALQFCRAWGCDVTAITTNASKQAEARSFGAHDVIQLDQLNTCRDRFDLVINTSNHALDWDALIACLAPRGRLHQLGVALQPMQISAMDLISGNRSVAGSSTASPSSLLTMLEFCARHNILPMVEHLPMSRINEAIARLHRGDVRYRFVLDGPA